MCTYVCHVNDSMYEKEILFLVQNISQIVPLFDQNAEKIWKKTFYFLIISEEKLELYPLILSGYLFLMHIKFNPSSAPCWDKYYMRYNHGNLNGSLLIIFTHEDNDNKILTNKANVW